MRNVTKQIPTVVEAAYIANISNREANRLVDERILPAELYERRDGRRLQLLACALGAFYFSEEITLTKWARKKAIQVVVGQAKQTKDYEAFLTLSSRIAKAEWSVAIGDVKIELFRYAIETKKRYNEWRSLEKYIVSDPDILNGEAVFKGTRVPVRTIAAWIKANTPSAEIREAYPGVTDTMLALAPIYERTHPRRGRPLRRKFGDINPDWKLKDTVRMKLSG